LIAAGITNVEIYEKTTYYEKNFDFSDSNIQNEASCIILGYLIMNVHYPITITINLQISLIKSSQGFSFALL